MATTVAPATATLPFAFKNLVLFVLIVLIVHVLLKSVLAERDFAHHCPRNAAPASVPTHRTTAESFGGDAAGAPGPPPPPHDKRREEDDVLKYVLEGDENDDTILDRALTPALTASWEAHAMPSRPPTTRTSPAEAAPPGTSSHDVLSAAAASDVAPRLHADGAYGAKPVSSSPLAGAGAPVWSAASGGEEGDAHMNMRSASSALGEEDAFKSAFAPAAYA